MPKNLHYIVCCLCNMILRDNGGILSKLLWNILKYKIDLSENPKIITQNSCYSMLKWHLQILKHDRLFTGIRISEIRHNCYIAHVDYLCNEDFPNNISINVLKCLEYFFILNAHLFYICICSRPSMQCERPGAGFNRLQYAWKHTWEMLLLITR